MALHKGGCEHASRCAEACTIWAYKAQFQHRQAGSCRPPYGYGYVCSTQNGASFPCVMCICTLSLAQAVHLQGPHLALNKQKAGRTPLSSSSCLSRAWPSRQSSGRGQQGAHFFVLQWMQLSNNQLRGTIPTNWQLPTSLLVSVHCPKRRLPSVRDVRLRPWPGNCTAVPRPSTTGACLLRLKHHEMGIPRRPYSSWADKMQQRQ